MIQSILAEISQKRRIHLYPSLARDESFPPPCWAHRGGLSRHPGRERGRARTATARLIGPTINTLKNDNCARLCNDMLQTDGNSHGSGRQWPIFALKQVGVLYSAAHWGVAAPHHARAMATLTAGERSACDSRGRLSTDLTVVVMADAASGLARPMIHYRRSRARRVVGRRSHTSRPEESIKRGTGFSDLDRRCRAR